MSLIGSIALAVGSLAGKAAVQVVKTGIEFGKLSGQGAVKGTATIVKEVAKRAVGS